MSVHQSERAQASARDLLLTALAPAIWGSSYIVSTELLPQVPPMTVALLRALPAGLLLLAFARRLPQGVWCRCTTLRWGAGCVRCGAPLLLWP